MLSVLGIDIGIKNLSFCHLLWHNTSLYPETIHDWKTINLTTQHKEDVQNQHPQCMHHPTCKRNGTITISSYHDKTEKIQTDDISVYCEKHYMKHMKHMKNIPVWISTPDTLLPCMRKSKGKISAVYVCENTDSNENNESVMCYWCWIYKGKQIPKTFYYPDNWIRYIENDRYITLPLCSHCYRTNIVKEKIKTHNYQVINKKTMFYEKYQKHWKHFESNYNVENHNVEMNANVWHVDPLEEITRRWFDFCKTHMPWKEHPPSYIWIENQPSLTNPVMKSIQMIVACGLLQTFPESHIRWISPNAKWKVFNWKTSGNYREHKKLSTIKMQQWLEKHKNVGDKWYNEWKMQKKKDDMADSFWLVMAGVLTWFIQQRRIKETDVYNYFGSGSGSGSVLEDDKKEEPSA